MTTYEFKEKLAMSLNKTIGILIALYAAMGFILWLAIEQDKMVFIVSLLMLVPVYCTFRTIRMHLNPNILVKLSDDGVEFKDCSELKLLKWSELEKVWVRYEVSEAAKFAPRLDLLLKIKNDSELMAEYGQEIITVLEDGNEVPQEVGIILLRSAQTFETIKIYELIKEKLESIGENLENAEIDYLIDSILDDNSSKFERYHRGIVENGEVVKLAAIVNEKMKDKVKF